MSTTHSVTRSVGPKPQTVREQLQKLQTADHSRIGTISSMTSKINLVRNMNNQSGATFLALQRQRSTLESSCIRTNQSITTLKTDSALVHSLTLSARSALGELDTLHSDFCSTHSILQSNASNLRDLMQSMLNENDQNNYLARISSFSAAKLMVSRCSQSRDEYSALAEQLSKNIQSVETKHHDIIFERESHRDRIATLCRQESLIQELHRQEIKISGDLNLKHAAALSLSAQNDECNVRIRLGKSALAELSLKIKFSKSATDALCQEETALASEERSFIKQISDISSKISEASLHINRVELTARDLQDNTVKLKNEIDCSLSNSRQSSLMMVELQQRKLCLSDRTEKFQQLSSIIETDILEMNNLRHDIHNLYADSTRSSDSSLMSTQISQSIQCLQANHASAQKDQNYLVNQLRRSELQFQACYTNYQNLLSIAPTVTGSLKLDANLQTRVEQGRTALISAQELQSSALSELSGLKARTDLLASEITTIRRELSDTRPSVPIESDIVRALESELDAENQSISRQIENKINDSIKSHESSFSVSHQSAVLKFKNQMQIKKSRLRELDAIVESKQPGSRSASVVSQSHVRTPLTKSLDQSTRTVQKQIGTTPTAFHHVHFDLLNSFRASSSCFDQHSVQPNRASTSSHARTFTTIDDADSVSDWLLSDTAANLLPAVKRSKQRHPGRTVHSISTSVVTFRDEVAQPRRHQRKSQEGKATTQTRAPSNSTFTDVFSF